MICLAELATIFHHKLPIKIFLFNNHSHGIQKQTLETWLGGRKVGVDPMSGVAFPANWLEVAKAFGFSTHSIDGTKELPNALDAIYAEEGPAFINVEINPDQKLYPVLKYGEALENQMPLLSEINIEKEMIVKLFKNDINATSDSKKTSYGW